MTSNEMNQLPAGIRIANNRYEISQVIGQGGFGITYRGYDLRLEMPVAIKEYYPSGIASRYSTQSLNVQVGGEGNRKLFEEGKKKFLEEARVLARFSDDPNVVGVRDFFEDNQTVYIVMEYLQGESLYDYGKRLGPLPFEEVYEMLRPVMQSLDAIHKSGLIHRDISPSNLIRLQNGKTKLIDFGTAREANPAGEKSLSVVLKPGYAPAEQYQSRGAQGPWSDVYALCASIYRLITGKTPENSLNRVMKDELAYPSRIGGIISPAAERVLMQGLAVQAGRRIQLMEQLMTEFDQALTATETAGGNKARPVLDEDDELTVRGAIPRDLDRDSLDSFAEPVHSINNVQRDPEPEKDRELKKDRKARKERARKERADAAIPKETGKEKERKGKDRKGKKKKKIPGPALALAGLVLAVILVCFFLLQPRSRNIESNYDGSKTASFKEIAVTSDDIKKAGNDSKVTHLDFYKCQLDDEAIGAIASMDPVQDIRMTNCTGFSSLDPLSGLKNLHKLDLSGMNYGEEGDQLLEGSAWFGEEFPQVENLILTDYKLNEDIAFLSHFSGLKSLFMMNMSGKVQGTFPEMTSLETLDIQGTDLSETDLSALGRSPLLEEVSMSNDGLKSLSFLAGAASLSSLTVDQNTLTSLEGLENQGSLTSLSANANKLKDISALATCPKITYLDANNNQIGDISALASCPELTSVGLGKNKIKDIHPLANCIKIESLDLENNQIADVSSLSGMVEMRRFKMSDNKVEDASTLRSCTGVLELEMNRNKIKNLDFCEEMINLVRLEAGENEIVDIGGLHNVTQLEDVRLGDNRISDVSILAKSADKLKNLVLDKNPLKDIKGIGECANLYALSMNECGLTDLKPLAGCPGLYYLSAYGNKLKSIEGLESCATLYALDLGENEITGLEGLEASTAGDMVLLLQNNKIGDLTGVNPLRNYICLSIYGNKIKDITVIETMSNINKSSGLIIGESKIYMDWIDTMTGEKLSGIRFRNPNIIGVPLDKQVNVKNDFQAARKETDWGSSYDETVFLSKEEADDQIASIRKEARQKAGLEKADPEEEEEMNEENPEEKNE